MAKKSKLHELLAVEGDLKGVFDSILDETANTFEKKADLFMGHVRSHEWLVEGEHEEFPDEHKHMAETVMGKLKYQAKSIVRYFDALLQKESTNQLAKADVVIDGETIMTDVPATFLLGMESRLKTVREVYLKIPTLPPKHKWEKDLDKGENVYSMVHPEEKFRTEKEFKVQVLYPHYFPKEGEKGESLPAQIDKVSETKNVGLYTKHVWSGMITPAEKSEMLDRIDKLMRAVKKARQRANSTEVEKVTMAKKMFDYIHGQ